MKFIFFPHHIVYVLERHSIPIVTNQQVKSQGPENFHEVISFFSFRTVELLGTYFVVKDGFDIILVNKFFEVAMYDISDHHTLILRTNFQVKGGSSLIKIISVYLTT